MTTKTDRPGSGWFRNVVTVADRTRGIESLRAYAPGSAILDLGSAEGDVSYWLVNAAGSFADCIDYNRSRLDPDRQPYGLKFFVADLNDIEAIDRLDLQERYDIVLALAILQKMDHPVALLDFAMRKCERFIAIRTPTPVINGMVPQGGTVSISEYVEDNGFGLHSEAVVPSIELGTTSWVAIFERRT